MATLYGGEIAEYFVKDVLREIWQAHPRRFRLGVHFARERLMLETL